MKQNTSIASALLQSAADALTGRKSSFDLRLVAEKLQRRVEDIDTRLSEIAPPKPGSSAGPGFHSRGGGAYEEAMASSGPDALAQLSQERTLLEAERAQLRRRLSELGDQRRRAEVRETHRIADTLGDLATEAEDAWAAYQNAVTRLRLTSTKISQALTLGERLGEPVPEVSAEVAVRVTRLLVSDARGDTGRRADQLRHLGVKPSRTLVAQAGMAPSAPVQGPTSDKAA